MKDSPVPLFVDVHQLKVGMYVHLDLGWMDHPFAMSSFRISSAEQIATIRGLGLQRVRWDPSRSDPGLLALVGAPEPPTRSEPDASAEPAQGGQRDRRRALLAAQRAHLAACEREFTQAAREFRQITDIVPSQPESARERSERLVDGFLDKIDGAHDTCIRLLHEAAGDRASTHSLNVTVLSMLLGRAMGMGPQELRDLGLGALLHDVGKLELPDRVRWKDELSSSAELQFYQEHVAHGVSLVRKMKLSPQATLVVAQHHEQADGRGFPQRLPAERISALARIVALVNRYDNLCNPLHPAKSLTPHEALSLIFAQMKQRFDAPTLSAFIKMMGVYPPGSVVELTDGRYALVVSVNSARPLKPRVIVHDPKTPAEEALIVNLEAHPELGVRRSLKPLQLPREALDYLSPRQRICYFFERAVESSEPEDEGPA
ncbi:MULTISPECIES: HD-GYP domain-containing protein [Caldimonas]|uniref:HD-GYP domain-containing protein n=3 Tax=Sphaerotilaceae TaxID=2975441 RepID=UPI00035EF6CC|nr:HD-GYP domain-containing protein [Caldimonas manganoxidans]GIX25092.1 MAG: HD family phosphohydrolase [Caldimonas sp.]